MATKTTRKSATVGTKVPTIAEDIMRLGQIADLKRPLNNQLKALDVEREAIIARLDQHATKVDDNGCEYVDAYTGKAWKRRIPISKITSDMLKKMRQDLGPELIEPYVEESEQVRWYVHNAARL